MSLRDDARAHQVKNRRLDRLIENDESGEILELVEDGTIGHAAVVRVLRNHYPDADITQNVVTKWRIQHGVKLL